MPVPLVIARGQPYPLKWGTLGPARNRHVSDPAQMDILRAFPGTSAGNWAPWYLVSFVVPPLPIRIRLVAP